MINASKLILIGACFFMVGCEIHPPGPHVGTVAVSYEPSYTTPTAHSTPYCGYEPYEVTPYYNNPWACYDSYGSEYCEWIFAGYYSECMETWYYDWDWCEWVLFDETCYAI